MVSIKGLNKAAVLAALYNASHPSGMGFLHYDPKPMTVEEANVLLGVGDDATQMFGQVFNKPLYFDYLKGRVMKVDLSGDEFNPAGYDRDNGQGAAAKVIADLIASGQVNLPETGWKHRADTVKAAEETKQHLTEKVPEPTVKNGVAVFSLGLDDVADVLGPAVDKAIGK